MLIDSLKRDIITKPIVVRLKGNSCLEANQSLQAIIDKNGSTKLYLEEDFDKACEIVIKLSK